MKKIIFTLLFLVSIVCDVMAQYDAMYIYRNDGAINAFLKADVDSMRYSKVDLDGIIHSEYVVNEVWTADSVYRIPLDVIDSVSFVTPPTEYKEGVKKIEKTLLQYIVAVDSLTLKLSLSTPSSMIPKYGDVLVMEEDHELFPNGFAGEVAEVSNNGETIDVICTLTSIDKIFETFYCVSTSYVVPEDNAAAKTRSVPPSSINGNSFVIPSTTFNWNTEISPNITKIPELPVSGGAGLSFEVQPSVKINTFFSQSREYGTYFSCVLHGELDLKESITVYGGLTWSRDFLNKPILEIPCGSKFVNFYVCPGAFISASANLTLEGSVSQKFGLDAAFDWSSQGEEVLNPFVTGGLRDYSADLTGSLDGSVQIGGFFEVGFNLLDCRVSRVCVRGERGVEMSGNFVLSNSDVASAEKETKLYEKLKQSQFKLDYVISEGLTASFLKYDRSWKNSCNINIHTWDVVPEFSNTQLTHEGGNYLKAYSELSGDCLFPISVGYKLFDSNNTEMANYDSSSNYTNETGIFEHEFSNLKNEGNYTVYPKVKLFGFDILASPKAELKNIMPEIKEFKVTSVDHSNGAYYNDGRYYDYRFYASTTVEISSLDGVSDWGYVYWDPYGYGVRISLKQFGTSWTDTRWAYYRNEPKSTVCLCPFVQYEGDENYYYGEDQFYTLEKTTDDIRDYLIRLYKTTNGDNWTNNYNWGSDMPITHWYGVYQGDNTKYYINLIDNNLVGYVDLRGCPSLAELSCENNQLTSIDVSGCTSLDWLYCEENQLTSLDVSGCTSLEALSCENNQLTSIDVSGCTSLPYLYCYDNQLTSLDVSGCTSLKDLYCYRNQLTSLNVSGCTSLTALNCRYNQLNSLDVSDCASLTALNCYDNQLTSLNVSGCTSLRELNCENNQLTSLDVSGCTSLKDLSCYGNQLTSLHVSGCTSLERLGCAGNQLTSLDVSGCTSLRGLNCSGNQLTSLDVSGCTSLKDLYCYRNQLTSLDVSGYSLLKELSCFANQLTSLNVSGCTSLENMGCSGNNMPSLDVSGCTSLRYLDCYNNQLTSLDVSGCTSLQKLECQNNQLTHLNVSGCTSLWTLDCYSNQLANLVVSGCINLHEIFCYNNQLTSLDISGCRSLVDLRCKDNHINQEIDESFDYLKNFEHDRKYNYTTVNKKTVYTTNEYGWWYPGEPKKGYHAR